jgi:pentatricopeptide repeat protein
VIEINPGYAMSYSNLAKIYFNLRQYDLAVRYYDEAVKLGFTDAAFSRVIEPLRQGK